MLIEFDRDWWEFSNSHRGSLLSLKILLLPCPADVYVLGADVLPLPLGIQKWFPPISHPKLFPRDPAVRVCYLCASCMPTFPGCTLRYLIESASGNGRPFNVSRGQVLFWKNMTCADFSLFSRILQSENRSSSFRRYSWKSLDSSCWSEWQGRTAVSSAKTARSAACERRKPMVGYRLERDTSYVLR